MSKIHHYKTSISWTGNKGDGTANYTAYERSHVISVVGKNEIHASSDPAFRGDSTRYNPEELLVSALSSCHMLWYLHLCAVNGIVVISYNDQATGIMEELKDGGGHFVEATLNPQVTVSQADMIQRATELHHEANEKCFIAQSVKFPVYHKPSVATNKQ